MAEQTGIPAERIFRKPLRVRVVLIVTPVIHKVVWPLTVDNPSLSPSYALFSGNPHHSLIVGGGEGAGDTRAPGGTQELQNLAKDLCSEHEAQGAYKLREQRKKAKNTSAGEEKQYDPVLCVTLSTGLLSKSYRGDGADRTA